MIVYWIGCLISVLTAWLGTSNAKGQRNKQAVIIFSAMPLVIIAALRYDVGRDYMLTYVPYFHHVQNGMVTEGTRLEPLYHLVNALSAFLGGGYELVFLICAVLFFIPLFSQIFRDSPSPALSIFLFVTMGYYFVYFNVMRQMIGCAILLYAVRYIEKKQFWPFLFCVLLAAGFHKSCIVFLVMYWFGRIRIKPLWALLLIAVVLVLSNLISTLLRFIISLTPFSIYFASIFDIGETAYVMLAINMVLLLFSSLFYRRDSRFQIYYNLQILAVCVTAYSGKMILFLRLLFLFGLPSVITLPIALSYMPNERSKKLMTAAVVLLYFLYMFYTVGIQNSNSVLPYQTIFSRW